MSNTLFNVKLGAMVNNIVTSNKGIVGRLHSIRTRLPLHDKSAPTIDMINTAYHLGNLLYLTTNDNVLMLARIPLESIVELLTEIDVLDTDALHSAELKSLHGKIPNDDDSDYVEILLGLITTRNEVTTINKMVEELGAVTNVTQDNEGTYYTVYVTHEDSNAVHERRAYKSNININRYEKLAPNKKH